MLLSQALKLNLSQPMLDFVDIDLDHDFPLYIDPIGFLNPQDPFGLECQADLQDFFDTVLKAIMNGDTSAAEALMAALHEPNETHLGVSDGEPRGRGIGPMQAKDILASLAASPAAKTGLLTDLTDCSLFIENIGADKISDITTNIIRRNLIEYTQQQFELLGVPIHNSIPAGQLWMRGEGRWDNETFEKIPIVQGKKVLLVPKRYVRWKGGVQQLANHYYTHFVTNFIKDEQLRTGGSLVRVLKTKKGTVRKVFKKDIRKKYRPTKKYLAEFSVENPAEYKKFKTVIQRRGTIGLRRLMEVDGSIFHEAKFNKDCIELLRGISTGRPDANNYHHFICGIMTYVFFPHLIRPNLELEINQGRKRIDISFANSSPEGAFFEYRTDKFLSAREVMVECKNYAEDLANNEIDQMIGRFDPRRGRLGIIACRSIVDPTRLLERCRDAMRAQQGAILVFTDEDFIKLLEKHGIDREPALQNMCREKFRELLK